MLYDIVIIGAGVTGAAAAHALSRYEAKVCVLERNEDVCSGTSKANSGIVHAGFDAKPGTLKAKLNLEGSLMMEQLAADLDIPYRRNGSLVLCLSPEGLPDLEALYRRGVENGVEGLELLSREEALAKEPNLSPNTAAALWAPTGAIICPFELNLAMAEHAADNGTQFRFDHPVTAIKPKGDHWLVVTPQGVLETRCIINAAGVYADTLHNMVSAQKLHITPRRGDYFLLDQTAGGHVSSTIFQLPGRLGKGVLVTPTVHGNLIVGPTAIDVDDPDGINTTQEGLDLIRSRCGETVRDLPLRETITSFAGLRAHEDGGDFIIRECSDAPGFFDCAGIESPGLTAAPAIGEMAAALLVKKLSLAPRKDYIPTRTGILNPKKLTFSQRQQLVRENPDYGQIICRCEMISKGEIVDAITRTLGAKSLDGIKRRCRPGMGRCQGGFCSPKVMELLHEYTGIPMTQITKCGGRSLILTGTTKEEVQL